MLIRIIIDCKHGDWAPDASRRSGVADGVGAASSPPQVTVFTTAATSWTRRTRNWNRLMGYDVDELLFETVKKQAYAKRLLSRLTLVPRAMRTLVEYDVTAISQAAFEHLLAHAIGLQAGLRSAVKTAVGRAFAGVARDRAGRRTDGGADDRALDDAFGDQDLLGIGFAFGPILSVLLGVDAFGIDDRIGMRRASA